MIEQFLGLVDKRIHNRSGAVLYSGRAAFSAPSNLYMLGLNPGGSPEKQERETVSSHIRKVLYDVPDKWSEYSDESWLGKPPGTHGMQPRLLHMLRQLDMKPQLVPASNVVFVRSPNGGELEREMNELMKMCWPVHKAIIDKLYIKNILCFGRDAGKWVRTCVGAEIKVDEFIENNQRGWKSEAHRAKDGKHVITVTHPGRVEWRNVDADPTPMVQRILDKGR